MKISQIWIFSLYSFLCSHLGFFPPLSFHAFCLYTFSTYFFSPFYSLKFGGHPLVALWGWHTCCCSWAMWCKRSHTKHDPVSRSHELDSTTFSHIKSYFAPQVVLLKSIRVARIGPISYKHELFLWPATVGHSMKIWISRSNPALYFPSKWKSELSKVMQCPNPSNCSSLLPMLKKTKEGWSWN